MRVGGDSQKSDSGTQVPPQKRRLAKNSTEMRPGIAGDKFHLFSTNGIMFYDEDEIQIGENIVRIH